MHSLEAVDLGRSTQILRLAGCAASFSCSLACWRRDWGSSFGWCSPCSSRAN